MASFKWPFQNPKTPEEHHRNGATSEVWIQRYAAKADLSAAYITAAAGHTKILLNRVIYSDRPGMFNTATSEFTLPADGLWVITGQTRADLNNAVQIFVATIGINGVYPTYEGDVSYVRGGAGGDAWGQDIHIEVPLRKGTTVGLGLFNSGGNTVNIPAPHNYLQIRRVGPHPDDQYR